MEDFEIINLKLSKKNKSLLGKIANNKKTSATMYEATALLNQELVQMVPVGEPINGKQIYSEDKFWITEKGKNFYLWYKENKKNKRIERWKLVVSFVLGIISTLLAEKLLVWL